MRLSVLTPAFNEADNLAATYERLAAAMHRLGVGWEWLIVDDHSFDSTFDAVRALALKDARVSGLRLSRRSGSHTAIACALHHATGDAAVVLAADLQDPPETLGAMLDQWRAGAQVVWAVRRQRPGVSAGRLGFARIYYFIMRHVVGMKEMPASGADFFLADRAVVEAFRRFRERHVSVLALITWMGFRQAFIEYDKGRRHSGKSGWTLAAKIKLVIDSVTGFSEAPIRACMYSGLGLAGVGIVGAIGAATMLPRPDAVLLLVLAVVVVLGGVQLFALGIVGEYVWRALEEARQRPPYLVEAVAGALGPTLAAHD
jgi:polyisoprenyl-phosphate glycosyltransferase